MNDTRQRLIRCFRAVFPSLAESEIPQATASTVESWDSVASVTLLATIEEEFGIEMAPEDMPDLISFEKMLSYLHAKGS